MKVIKHGNVTTTQNKQETCPECSCIFEYHEGDIKYFKEKQRELVGKLFQRYETFYYVFTYVICPDCGKSIKLGYYKF